MYERINELYFYLLLFIDCEFSYLNPPFPQGPIVAVRNEKIHHAS